MKRVLILSFLCAITLNVNANVIKPTRLFLDMGEKNGATCSVKNSGYAVDPKVKFTGKKEDWYGTENCLIEVSDKVFKQHFSMCFVTGVFVKGTGQCGFKIYDTENQHTFSMLGTATECSFTCM